MTFRAEEEYVPEHEQAEDVEEVVGELAEDQTEEEEVEEEVAQEPDKDALELVRRVTVVGVVRDLLDQRSVASERMAVLTDHEREALGFLHNVVEGRTQTGRFIYAEQRLEQLNLVLADLQPLLAVGGMEGLDVTLGEIVDGIDHLRHELELLEEAQEEVRHEVEEKKGDEDDEDDKGDDGEADEATAAGGSLTGEPTAADGKAVPAPADGKNPPAGEASKPGFFSRVFGGKKKPDDPQGGGP